MNKVVICGAGPIGLYLAIRLKQMGVKDIVVYDLRAGEYVRPGHLNRTVFITAEQGLKIPLWDHSKTGHIKDLEKTLYAEACKLGIKIEKKRFVGYMNKPGKKGVIVEDSDKNQTEVESYITFDCTGSRREAVHALNIRQPGAFTLTPIIQEKDLLIKRHFLAYVKMQPQHYRSLRDSNFEFYSAEQYVEYMEKFRAMGWKEFTHPYFYEKDFTNNKVCMYIEQPDSLAPELYGQWLQTVLEFHSIDPSIRYELCVPKGDKKKPRFNAFTVDPKVLSPLSFAGSRQLPTVVAQGDAQIDFNHRLAHGVEDGLERVETFLKDLDIIDGVIYFDGSTFASSVEPELTAHQEKLVRHYKRQKTKAEDILSSAKAHYTKAFHAAADADTQLNLHDTLLIIEARISHKAAIDALALCGSSLFKKLGANDLALLDKVQADIANAEEHLTELYAGLRAELPEMRAKLAQYYKVVGNDFFQKKSYEEAAATYIKSLKLIPENAITLDRLTLVSNLMLCYKNLGELRDGIELLSIALTDTLDSDKEIALKKEKIIFNFVQCLASALKKEANLSGDLLLVMNQVQQRLSSKSKIALKASLEIIAEHGYLDLEDPPFLFTNSKTPHFFNEQVMNGSSKMRVTDLNLGQAALSQ
ncbi:hypothetical protein BN59_02778 [Legionella massiliensis]|uniref:Uncharacterized protein n=1 Tax=Legionella massiliensis TaxID=1034943 RepID=A0A078L3F3_9GAMM|nr:hypothetical protein [Legionella massiliensis]CDZ78468.1 hypothetical protein BN59_02778 [Legionella massiliensis]CEE14206.1 hypothetical protein BN1094_02778 [Legionella massiliensis]